MKGYKNIIIPINGSLGPLKEGLKIAAAENCWVTVLKVLPPYEGDIDLTGIKDISDVLSSGRDQAVRTLRRAVRDEGGQAWVRIEEGVVSETINRVAKEDDCDLIVMGSKSNRGILDRFLGDKTVEKVMHGAPCSVRVVNV